MVLYDNGSSFALLDAEKNITFSKSFYFNMQPYRNIEWANDSNYFILYNERNICMYNLFNFSVKYWTNFANEIKVWIIYIYKYFRVFQSTALTIEYLCLLKIQIILCTSLMNQLMIYMIIDI